MFSIQNQLLFYSTISPTDNLFVGISAFGEGWHNYHHVFPWDYKAGELGNYRTNITTAFIDFFASIGWAYDLKTVAHNVVKKRANRTGDGSTYERIISTEHDAHQKENAIWGWDDVDMKPEDMQKAEIINKAD
jgi:stearoyl-CoA desaturase (delta-9 desaturase)